MTVGISLDQAQAVISAGAKHAEAIGVPMNIAVVDAGANLTAFVRQDGAWLGSIEIAQNKAFTARAFDAPTKDLDPLVQPGAPLYMIGASNGGHIITFPGGIPITVDGEIVGAVGVSGGSVEQDHEVAEAAVGGYRG